MAYYMGIDIGGTSIKAGIVNESGEILETERFSVPKDWENLLDVIKSAYFRKKGTYNIHGIGIASPGTVNPVTGCISGLAAPSLSYLYGNCYFDLEKELKMPVSAEQDAKSAALGELWVGNGIGVKDAVVLVLGSGLGGCIIIDGKVHHGSNLFAGDVGYGYLTNDEDRSISGSFSTVSIEQLYQSKTNRFLTIPEMYNNSMNDAVAKEVYDYFMGNLSNLINSLQFIIDPEVFLIGGGISEWEPLIGEIRKTLAKLNQIRENPIMPKVLACKNKNGANIIGAVRHLKMSRNI